MEAAPSARYVIPRKANGTSIMMMRALKMTAAKIAERGFVSPMKFSAASCG